MSELLTAGLMLTTAGLLLIMFFGNAFERDMNFAERWGVIMVFAGSAAITVSFFMWLWSLL
jgi:hypothetical protein